MAKTETPPPAPQGPMLEPDDVLGVIKHNLEYLTNYCKQPSNHVDREIVFGLMQKISYWLGFLPPVRAANDAGAAATKKAS